jgi:signal peptidase II
LPGPVDLTLVFNYSNAFGLVPVSGELTRWGLTALKTISCRRYCLSIQSSSGP